MRHTYADGKEAQQYRPVLVLSEESSESRGLRIILDHVRRALQAGEEAVTRGKEGAGRCELAAQQADADGRAAAPPAADRQGVEAVGKPSTALY